jgi:hypothetical protein
VVVGTPEAINCPTGECTYTEHIRFPVNEALLRQLAAGAGTGAARMWTFTVMADSGGLRSGGRPSAGDYAGALSTAEMAGLLAKVDELGGGAAASSSATQSLDPGSPAAARPLIGAAPSRDLGVGAMRIDAAEESPPRAGLLLTAVNRGSVAQKSGLLVGDILYEADGRAILSLSDLQAALAASRAKSALTLKLFRGTARVTVTAQF